MQITRQTEYALRTILELSAQPFGEYVQTRVIAEKRQISGLFLAKTIQILARAGLVQTQRGVQGGVRLSRPGSTITLKEVISVMEGEPSVNRCLSNSSYCEDIPSCKVHTALARAREALLQELENVTFDQLV